MHEPSAPYRPVSEPLVHLRAAAAYLASYEIVTPADARAAIEDLKSRWYGERTVRRLGHALRPRARIGSGFDRELRDFDCFRTKAIDLARFLEERPFA